MIFNMAALLCIGKYVERKIGVLKYLLCIVIKINDSLGLSLEGDLLGKLDSAKIHLCKLVKNVFIRGQGISFVWYTLSFVVM